MRVINHWNGLLRELVDAVPGSTKGQVGQGFEHPDLVEKVPPSYFRWVGFESL